MEGTVHGRLGLQLAPVVPPMQSLNCALCDARISLGDFTLRFVIASPRNEGVAIQLESSNAKTVCEQVKLSQTNLTADYADGADDDRTFLFYPRNLRHPRLKWSGIPSLAGLLRRYAPRNDR